MAEQTESENLPSSIIQQLDLANFLTLTGLMLGFFSAICALHSQFYGALICLIYAGLADVFDGFVAQKIHRTKWQSAVGKQLDSLVDICSFGFSPAIFAYCFGLRDTLSIVLLMMYLGACGLRLAFFNSVGLYHESGNFYYIGMPVTYAALFIPLSFFASFFLAEWKVIIILKVLYLSLTIAMVSEFKIIKLKGIWYGAVLFAALIMTGIYSWAIARQNQGF